MIISFVVVLTFIAAISSAAAAGMMYAFSTFVMRGLDRTGPVQAITAMRGINTEANSNAAFLLVYVGAAVLAAALGATAAVQLHQPGSWYLLVGSVVGVLAAIITMAFNVPLNNRLDALDPGGLSAADAWRDWQAYSMPWTAWNHVRTVAPLAGSALMLVGLYRS